MKISTKQLQEIQFLEKYFNTGVTSELQKEEYIRHTVGGEKIDIDSNPLFQSKRLLDISIKLWREDLTIGLISVDELRENFDCEYFNNLINSLLIGITKEYRFKKLTQNGGTILSFTNFPKIMEKFKEIK